MRLHAKSSFNIMWRKQVLAFQLLACMHAKKGKFKMSLKANYAAQTIVAVLDEEQDRNLDYLLSVNTLTAYLLLQVKKPGEALEFIKIAERIAYRLLKNPVAAAAVDLAIIGESENEVTDRQQKP